MFYVYKEARRNNGKATSQYESMAEMTALIIS